MNKILVPLDYSSVGINALRYALQMFPKSEITVLYVKSSMTEYSDEFWFNSVHRLIMKELELDIFPENIAVHIAHGSVIPQIQNFSAKHSYEAIVMGTRDKYSYFDKWLGTVSLATVKKSKIPVYLIPKFARYSPLKKVLVASDTHLSDPAIVNDIYDWNKNFNAFIKFLHVSIKGSESFAEENENIITELVEKRNPSFSFEVAVLYEKEITQSLLATAHNMKADMLIAMPGKQSFLDSILFKSVTKELILNSDLPILFINNNN